MAPIFFLLQTFLLALGAGAFGALLGLGGGVILVPLLTLWLGVDIHYAIGASILAVIATSSGSAAAFLRDGIANLRVAMYLETGSAAGAILGAVLAGYFNNSILFIFFSAVLFNSAFLIYRRRDMDPAQPTQEGPLARYLNLSSAYHDSRLNRLITYKVRGARYGLPIMFVVGIISGLLGIGSGVLNVLALELAMKLPFKAATATSNLMLGVTAAASAGVYLARGDAHPFVAAPVALGVLVGSRLGAAWVTRADTRRLRGVFIAVLILIGAQMLARGLGIF